MGQKVNPHGLRVGVIKDWDSRWFTTDKKEFGNLLLEDHNVRNFLKKRFEKTDYKQKFDEPYGLKNSMLPLKYMTKNIIQENERKDLGFKTKRFYCDNIIKRKF